MNIKIAIPSRDGKVDEHFGHCAFYSIVEVDEGKQIISTSTIDSPEGCGCKSDIASRLQMMGVTVMLVGNIGQGAVNKLECCGIHVIKGQHGEISGVVRNYLRGEAVDYDAICAHHDCNGH